MSKVIQAAVFLLMSSGVYAESHTPVTDAALPKESAQAPAATPMRLDTIAERIAALKRPDSCEAQYYGLFTDWTLNSRKTLREPTPAVNEEVDFGQAYMVFERLKSSLSEVPYLQRLHALEPAAAVEWALRLQQAVLRDGDVGAFTTPVRPQGPALPMRMESKSLLKKEPLKTIRKEDGSVLPSTSISWGPGSPGTGTDSAKAFYLGHEAAHLIDWAPEPLRACLASAEGGQVQTDIEKKVPASEIFALHRELADSIVHQKLLAIAQDKRAGEESEMRTRFEELRQAAKKSKPATEKLILDDIAEEQAEYARSVRSLTESMDASTKKAKALREKLQQVDPQNALQAEVLKFDALVGRCVEAEHGGLRLIKPPGIGSDAGFGTTGYRFFKDCLSYDTKTAKELFRMVQKYQVDEILPNIEINRNQIAEAAPDFFGVEIATHWITKLSAAEQKAAALDVLRSMPPTLVPESERNILDKVGIKPTNERRVMRILLANPHFRQFLGCEMETHPAAIYCGE